MKNYISILIVVVITLCCGTAFAFNVPAHNGFVNDYAGNLKPNQLEALNAKVQEVNSKTTNEIGVMIISSLEGESIEDVANQTWKSWKIGKVGLDNGVLLIISVNDRKMRIQTGKGVEGDLTDLQTQDIQDHMKPYLRKNDFYGAVNLAVNEIGSSIESRKHQKAAVNSGTSSCQSGAPGWSGTGLLAIATLAVALILYHARRNRINNRNKKEQADRLRKIKQEEAIRDIELSQKDFKKENTFLRAPLLPPPGVPIESVPVPAPSVPTKKSTYDDSSSFSYSPEPSYDSSSSGSFDSGSSFGGGDFGGGGSSSDF